MKTLARTALERTLDECKRHIEILEENQEALLTALSEANLRVLYLLKSVRVKKQKSSSPFEIDQAPQFEEGTLGEFYMKERDAFLKKIQQEDGHAAQAAQAPSGRVVAIDAAQLTRRTH